jgi:hypothetical protein
VNPLTGGTLARRQMPVKGTSARLCERARNTLERRTVLAIGIPREHDPCMDSAQQAILAMAVMTPLALGLYIAGRWRQGDLRPRRDSLVVAGTIGWVIVLAAAFAGPPAVVLLVPPLGLFAGGAYLWVSEPDSRMARRAGVWATILGAFGLVIGVLRLVL